MGIMDTIKSSKASTPIAIVVAIALIVVIVYEIKGNFGSNEAEDASNHRVYICSDTLKSFNVNLADLQGQTIPIYSPYSGKNTGFPAELCYWTADGHVKKDPTPVLLNFWINKSGPTFCPDCGRLVVNHNPMAMEGHTPPMTKDEWEAKNHSKP